jgi:hypothetical protein
VEQNTSVESVIVVYVVMNFFFTSIFFPPKSWTMIQKHKLSLLHGSKNIALQAQILVFTSWVMVQIVASTLSLVVFACVSIQRYWIVIVVEGSTIQLCVKMKRQNFELENHIAPTNSSNYEEMMVKW